MVFSGTSADGKLAEVIELPGHPWYLAVQCHPEFRSKPTQCHPLFRAFVRASLERREARKKAEAGRARGMALRPCSAGNSVLPPGRGVDDPAGVGFVPRDRPAVWPGHVLPLL